MKKSIFFILCAFTCTLISALAGAAPPPTIPAARQDTQAVADFSRSLVRVNCTSQAYELFRPWTKRNPTSRRGIGVIVAANQVLVTADLVQNHTYIEFERPASGERAPAKLLYLDYDANLALLAASDPAFLVGAIPLALDETARVGSMAEILQLEPNGDIAPTAARITTITVSQYSLEDVGLLIFRLTAPIQQREGSFVLPAVKDGRLLGLLMRYDSRNQTADVIPPEIIECFLRNNLADQYAAFPRAGMGIAPLRDPQLRRYLGLKENGSAVAGGVLVTKVDRGSSAEKAGLLPNDILLSIDDNVIDSDGNFTHLGYGRIPLSYLITTAREAGEIAKFRVLRKGLQMDIRVPLERRNREKMSVPPYSYDRQPSYLVVGGFVFQELSRAYLMEWGADWRGSAPQRLVYADQFQQELRPNGEKVVFLSAVIPTPATLGYENLAGLLVREVNGKPIHSLLDLQTALADAPKGLYEIKVEDDPRVLYLDAALSKDMEGLLAEQYGITQLSNLHQEATAPKK